MATLPQAGGCLAFRPGTVYSSAPTEPRQDYPSLDQPTPAALAGRVPLLTLLQVLEISDYPRDVDLTDTEILVHPGYRLRDVIYEIESSTGWIYDAENRYFVEFYATHSIDSPDALGRTTDRQAPLTPRSAALLTVRLLNVGLASGASEADFNPIDASVSLQEIAVSVPDGVRSAWNSTENRTFRNGVVQPIGESAVVETNLETRSAGIQLEALVARLPGGAARVDGIVSISAFTTGLDTATVAVPLQLDFPRGRWMRIYRTRTAAASATILLRAFGVSAASGQVALEIRVD